MYVSVPELEVKGSYEGAVSEAGGTVQLTPPLTARHGPICGYRLVATHKGKLPFEVSFAGVCFYCQCFVGIKTVFIYVEVQLQRCLYCGSNYIICNRHFVQKNTCLTYIHTYVGTILYS